MCDAQAFLAALGPLGIGNTCASPELAAVLVAALVLSPAIALTVLGCWPRRSAQGKPYRGSRRQTLPPQTCTNHLGIDGCFANNSSFQCPVRLGGATVILNVDRTWTKGGVLAALEARTGRSLGNGCYLVPSRGKPLRTDEVTLGAIGLRKGDTLQVWHRIKGAGCGVSKAPAETPLPAPGSVDLREAPGSSNQPAPPQLVPPQPAAAAPTPPTAPVPPPQPDPDPLTAEQRSEKAREAEALATELAAPSKWDEIGCAVLKAALLTTVLVDAWWLWQLAEAGGILPRSQDLPPGARVTLADLEKWECDYTVGVLIISYPWLDADHPDRNGEQLRKIAPVLKIFAEHAKKKGGKVGVFIDYCSLPQRSRASHRAGAAAAEAAKAAAKAAGADAEAQSKAAAKAHKSKDDRTPEELATFAAALANLNAWYAHRMTHVLQVDTPLPVGDYTNLREYRERGWCEMEYRASGMVKDEMALISLRQLTGKEIYLSEVRDNGKGAREPPTAPEPFAAGLARDLQSGAKGFTHKGDLGLVTGTYDKAFETEMAQADELYYVGMKWSDADGVALVGALRAAHERGGLQQLETLSLGDNQMGDETAAALASLLEAGAMPKLKVLDLSFNRIGEAGMAALASAVRGGALPSCAGIALSGNPGSAAPVQEAFASAERAQRKLEQLRSG